MAQNSPQRRDTLEWQLLDVLRAHRYKDDRKGSKPDDPGWHACTCGWEGYWCDWQPHVAERQATQLRGYEAHVLTDPACRYHVPPVTREQAARFERLRGRACPACVPRPRLPDPAAAMECGCWPERGQTCLTHRTIDRIKIQPKPDARKIHEALLRWKRGG